MNMQVDATKDKRRVSNLVKDEEAKIESDSDDEPDLVEGFFMIPEQTLGN